MSSVLIVNADDFGHSAEVNAGVIEAHERGIVTSASLMVRRPAAAAAAAYEGSLDLGLHVELDEWADRNGGWHSPDAVAEDEIAAAVRTQLREFRRLTGREPTHLDTHHHAHRREPARTVLLQLGDERDVPVRELRGGISYVGRFYGQDDVGNAWPRGVSVDALLAILRELEPGVTEVGCHPGRTGVTGSSYAELRARELETLCDPRVADAIRELRIELAGFAAIRRP